MSADARQGTKRPGSLNVKRSPVKRAKKSRRKK